MRTYLKLSELMNRTTPAQDLIYLVRASDWNGAFAALAILAARLSASPDETSRQLLAALAGLSNHEHPPIAAAGRAAAAYRGHARLVHEQVIYFLQALVLLEAGDAGGTMPSDGSLALWALIANEHLHNWLELDARPLTALEGALADQTYAAHFNVSEDQLHRFARTALMFEHRPEHAKLGQNASTWEELQERAFGRPFAEAHRSLIAPLLTWSSNWGHKTKDNQVEPPVIDIPNWIAPTLIDRAEMEGYLGNMATTRDDAIVELRAQRRPSGLPHSPALFYRKPFVRAKDNRLMAASPAVIAEKMRAGIWFQFSEAATQLGCDRDDWPSAFGHLFEWWCGRVASLAASSSKFPDHVFIPTHPGASDEIEDVVTYDGSGACLFSAKGKLVSESVARRALERSSVVDWYEEFFFGKRGKRQGRAYRDGVVRLLNERIDLIRAGAFRDRLRPTVQLFPALMTFDNIGECPALYQWLRQRCASENLLQQSAVAPLTLVRVDRFEQLMALAARGTSTVDVLRRKARSDSVDRLFDRVLGSFASSLASFRLPALAAEFERITDEVNQALFGDRHVTPSLTTSEP